jgi:hypothetical protein
MADVSADFVLFLDSILENANSFKDNLSKYFFDVLNLQLNETRTKVSAYKEDLIHFLGLLIKTQGKRLKRVR